MPEKESTRVVNFAVTQAPGTAVYVSALLGYAYTLEGVIYTSTLPAPGNLRQRLLLSRDNDTLNPANPTGVDVLSGDSQSRLLYPFVNPVDLDMAVVQAERNSYLKVVSQNLDLADVSWTLAFILTSREPGP